MSAAIVFFATFVDVCQHQKWWLLSYPLVSDPPFSMGTGTISSGPFPIANCESLPKGNIHDYPLSRWLYWIPQYRFVITFRYFNTTEHDHRNSGLPKGISIISTIMSHIMNHHQITMKIVFKSHEVHHQLQHLVNPVYGDLPLDKIPW